jgi:ribonuclease D
MADLEQIAALARESGRVGIDTEFMAEGRYRPLLCLVVVGVDDPSAPDGVRTVLSDPLARAAPGPRTARRGSPRRSPRASSGSARGAATGGSCRAC